MSLLSLQLSNEHDHTQFPVTLASTLAIIAVLLLRKNYFNRPTADPIAFPANSHAFAAFCKVVFSGYLLTSLEIVLKSQSTPSFFPVLSTAVRSHFQTKRGWKLLAAILSTWAKAAKYPSQLVLKRMQESRFQKTFWLTDNFLGLAHEPVSHLKGCEEKDRLDLQVVVLCSYDQRRSFQILADRS